MGCGESDQRKGDFPPSKRKSSAWSLDTQHGSGEGKLGQQEYRSNSIEERTFASLSISRLAVRPSPKLFDCISSSNRSARKQEARRGPGPSRQAIRIRARSQGLLFPALGAPLFHSSRTSGFELSLISWFQLFDDGCRALTQARDRGTEEGLSRG